MTGMLILKSYLCCKSIFSIDIHEMRIGKTEIFIGKRGFSIGKIAGIKKPGTIARLSIKAKLINVPGFPIFYCL